MKSSAVAPQLDIFQQPRPRIVRTPPLKIDAPSVPSKSSEDAADAIVKSLRRPTQWRRVIIALYKLRDGQVLSREELSERTEIKESTLCARLADLMPMWVEKVENCVRAKSKMMVDGYRITANGRALCETEEISADAGRRILKEWGADA